MRLYGEVIKKCKKKNILESIGIFQKLTTSCGFGKHKHWSLLIGKFLEMEVPLSTPGN